MDLGIGVDVVASLDVHDHEGAERALEGEACEGVRREPVRVHSARVGDAVVDKPRVVVVLDESSFLLHGPLDRKGEGDAAPVDLHDPGLQEVDALGRLERIVQPRVPLRHHLHLDVVKVRARLLALTHIALGHVVVAVLPRHVEEEVGVDLGHLLHAVALAHGALGERLRLHLDQRLRALPHVAPRVVVPPAAELRRTLVDLERRPSVVVVPHALQRRLEGALPQATRPVGRRGSSRQTRRRRRQRRWSHRRRRRCLFSVLVSKRKRARTHKLMHDLLGAQRVGSLATGLAHELA